MSSENKRKIISTTYNIFNFSRMLPKMSVKMGKDIFARRQCTSMVFDSLKYHVFLYVITRYTFLVGSLLKNINNG